MFRIYVEVPEEKSGCASAYSLSKMLEKNFRSEFPTTKHGEKISVNILNS
jgi:hypothetical protein